MALPSSGSISFGQIRSEYTLNTQDSPSVDLENLKWLEIRNYRNFLLMTSFDPKIPYIIVDDIKDDEFNKLKAYRQQLLDIPEIIQTEIDSGKFSSVLDVDINTYSWPTLG